jgi:hypothetical protein
VDAFLMIYRKASPRPTRFVLKIVTAGAGAVLGVACSSSGVEGSTFMGVVDSGPDTHEGMGFVANPEAGDEWQVMGTIDAGLMPNPEAGDEQAVGVVPNPEAGDENWAIGLDSGIGVVPNPEAGDEHPVVGVVANPEAGHD